MLPTSITQSKWERASRTVKKYAKYYLVLLSGKHPAKGIVSAVIAVSVIAAEKFKPASRYPACCLVTQVAKATEASDTSPSSWWILPLKYRNRGPELIWWLFGSHFSMPGIPYLIIKALRCSEMLNVSLFWQCLLMCCS